MKNGLILVLILIFIMSCAGEDTLGTDTTPPEEPVMVPHLGDTGDIAGDEIINYSNYSGYENNGIDAVPEDNWIKIQWESLVDNDIDYIQILRFNLQQQTPIKIDSVSYTTQNHYTDQFQNYDTAVNKNWFYYITVYDIAGNYSISDTTCYRLIDKPQLLSPANYTIHNSGEPLVFEWDENTEALTYRLLVFKNDYELLWSHTPTDHPGGTNYSVEYNGPDLSDYDTLIWRVDAFGNTLYEELNNTTYEIFSGSESQVNTLFIQQK
ncbi:MAG: hypothetical protein SVM86_07445 [Candidatus Cloacimonadota bacterium]|nr:hypothetical protein [Candidatus Cloacimonadota bacterium]